MNEGPVCKVSHNNKNQRGNDENYRRYSLTLWTIVDFHIWRRWFRHYGPQQSPMVILMNGPCAAETTQSARNTEETY